jgi:ParB family chromosome partitioning protein
VLLAQRTLALRAEPLGKPEVALLVLAHRLISAAFHAQYAAGGAVQVELRTPSLPDEAQCGAAWECWQAKRDALQAALPEAGGVALMAWLQRQPRAVIDDYLAFCLSCGVHGLPGSGGGNDEVAALAQVVGLTCMRGGSRPRKITLVMSARAA